VLCVVLTFFMQKHPSEYIRVLLEVHKKYRKYVALHLGNDPRFLKAFEKVVVNFP